MLLLYYKTLFPSKQLCRWLTYGGGEKYLGHREFSFTLPGDIYVRYQSYKNCDEFVKNLISKLPIKIDIGAVFDKEPRDNKKTLDVLMPLERELIFDIDINDYDEIRNCCKGTTICANCWRFCVIAVKILDRSLREDFGFQNILWVYSGRRGIHGWVCDTRARRLTAECRTALVDYLSLIEGGDFKKKRVTLPANKNIHPSIERACDIIDEEFVDFIVVGQKMFESNYKGEKMADLCRDSELRTLLKSEMHKNPSLNGKERWNRFEGAVDAFVKDKNFTRTHARYFLKELKLQLCYPRLDVNVSRGINHLLKSPFCVHPGTQRVCVPVDPFNIDNFDPAKVPTIEQLFAEIDSFDSKNPGQKSIDNYLKTSLKEPISLFNKFVTACEKEAASVRSAEAKNNGDADW